MCSYSAASTKIKLSSTGLNSNCACDIYHLALAQLVYDNCGTAAREGSYKGQLQPVAVETTTTVACVLSSVSLKYVRCNAGSQKKLEEQLEEIQSSSENLMV